MPLKDIAKLFENIFKVKLNIIWGNKAYKKREVMTVWNHGDILPNWHPVYSLEDGLKKIASSC